MANETTGRQRLSAHDAMLIGYDDVDLEMKMGRIVDEAPASDAYGLVVRSAGDVPVKPTPSSLGTTSQVPDSASVVTLKAANSARLGLSIQNTSSAALCVRTGAAATTSNYTVRLVNGAYWEAPYGYTGIVTGIWETDPNDGQAKITEYTA